MMKMLIKIKSFKKKFADQNKDLIKKKSWLSLKSGPSPCGPRILERLIKRSLAKPEQGLVTPRSKIRNPESGTMLGDFGSKILDPESGRGGTLHTER